MHKGWLTVLVLVAIALGGCETSPRSTESDPPRAIAADIPITVGSREELDKLLAANEGQVVFVDFWSTSCGPCMENFPHTVELSNRYRDQGLATIAVSLDDPENLDNVKAFLATQQDMAFDHLLSRDGMGTKSAEAFDLSGALPHYRLYDRSGALAYSWDGLPDDLEAKIQELLAKK